MPTLSDVVETVERTYKDLQSRQETFDKELKKVGEAVTAQGGTVPAEYKAAMDRLNADIARAMSWIKEYELEAKRPRSAMEKGEKQSTGTKAFLKALKYGRDFYRHMDADELKELNPHEHNPNLTPQQKALYAGDATTGGFFAAVDFQNKLQEYQILTSPVRSVAQVVSTSGEKVEFPNLINDTSAYYAVEQQNFTDSNDPSLGMLNIPVHEIRGLVKLSKQNLEDSVFDLETFLLKRLSKKFAQREGTAFIIGNGNGQPRGIMNYATSLAYNATATPTGKQTGLTYIPYIPSGNASDITPDCLITAMHDLKTYYRPSSTWALTTSTLGRIRLFKDSQNRPLWQPFAAGGLPATIYDRPYIEMPDLDEIAANKFPIIIGDFSEGYLIADRVTLNMQQLNELFAIQGLVAYIARARHGGDILLPEAFRFVKCSTT